LYDFDVKRTSLVANLTVDTKNPPLCFSGHLDTVPFNEANWEHPPTGGGITADKIYGRGASDMKGGVAAMLSAGLEIARREPLKAGIMFILTAGEESGCQGARHLVSLKNALGTAGALLVAEPTGNRPYIAHKGALWLKVSFKGKAAHGSMPEQGDNAIYRAARLVNELQLMDLEKSSHPHLGIPTLNIGKIWGGSSINTVPDEACLLLDIRTTPSWTDKHAVNLIKSLTDQHTGLEILLNLSPVESDIDHPWIQSVFELCGEDLSRGSDGLGLSYFTDAAVLTPYFGNVPTVIMGPGNAAQAHAVDEYCSISNILRARDSYYKIATDWCGISP
jgi:succinyl-diaminopimelate desuccinylase